MKNSPEKDRKPIPTIVVSRPGIMQRSLRVILTNCQEIDVISYTGDALTAIIQVREHRPGLLVIDHNLLEEEVDALLLAVNSEYPEIQCLVVTSSMYKEAHLTTQGADAVVLRNAPQKELKANLLQLVRKVNQLRK